MGKVVVYADRTCDLSAELIMEHNIGIIPLYVTFGEEIFKDKLEINPDILYKKVEQKGIMPKTSAAPMGDYYEVFKQELDKGNKLFSLVLVVLYLLQLTMLEQQLKNWMLVKF